jgi:hypothetical protein
MTESTDKLDARTCEKVALPGIRGSGFVPSAWGQLTGPTHWTNSPGLVTQYFIARVNRT